MSVPAFAWAMEQGASLGLSPAERLVLIFLADKANGVRVCWPGRETIAHYTGLALRTVRSVVGALARRGLIMVEDSPGRVSRYHILRAETPANENGASATDYKVIHSPGKASQGAPANGARVDRSEGGTSRRAPRHMTVTTPANGATEPYLTKKEPEERGACAPEGKSQDLDSGVKEASEPASQQAPPAPAYDPTFTTADEPKADPEAAREAFAAAIRAVKSRNPKRLATKYPANSVDQQLAATQGPPPPPPELKLNPKLADAVLAARAALAESAARRWQAAA